MGGGGRITLGDRYVRLQGGEGSGVLGGYFATLGGRMLKPGTLVGRLGLEPTVEVVFHGRVKGGVLVAARRPGPGGMNARVAGQEHLLQVWAPGTLGWRQQSGGRGWWAGQGRRVPRWSGHEDGRLVDPRPKWP